MADGLVTLRSAFDPAETKARLLAILKEKGLTAFADIPHAKGAAKAGLVLGPSDLVIFGSRRGERRSCRPRRPPGSICR
jgi:uncharacterized protein (DUF302 family)